MINLGNENAIRLICFFSVLMLMAAWERISPRKKRIDSVPNRWMNNLSLAVLDTGVVKILFPLLPVSFATFMEAKGWGILNHLGWPAAGKWFAAIVILDFIIYLQHVLFHKIPALWRLHRVHHSDLDIDVTTGVRFHPIEIIISMGIKLGAVAVFGLPGSAVLLFEMLLNATSLFNHSNVYMPPMIDRVFRLFIVTPDMHRVHHSVIIQESDRNFGFNLSWWDRIFGTYQAQPSEGHDNMVIGLLNVRNPISFLRLLLLPFVQR